jgi:hypothetical protein
MGLTSFFSVFVFLFPGLSCIEKNPPGKPELPSLFSSDITDGFVSPLGYRPWQEKKTWSWIAEHYKDPSLFLKTHLQIFVPQKKHPFSSLSRMNLRYTLSDTANF